LLIFLKVVNGSSVRAISRCPGISTDTVIAELKKRSGHCRVPKSWKLLYKTGNDWKKVVLTEGSAYRNEKETLNAVDFAPVTTNSLRLEVALPKGFSAGLFEWAVE
jgi:hypothetical protein